VGIQGINLGTMLQKEIGRRYLILPSREMQRSFEVVVVCVDVCACIDEVGRNVESAIHDGDEQRCPSIAVNVIDIIAVPN
jgi:hypothetical protein